MMKWIFAALLILFVTALIFPRVATDDPARWHVDPTTVTPSEKPNSYLVADHDAVRLPLTPAAVLARVDRIAMAQPRVTRLARDEQEGRVTYVQRSALFGFPDYISVRVVPDGDGSRLSIYSRSRFGESDLGVNKARIERWLKTIESNVSEN